MLKIRLKKTGKKNAPSYRIVVTDARNPRDGKAIEEIGWYNPTEDPQRVEYRKERLEYWTSCGAQMTKAVETLIKGEYKYIPYTGSEEAPKPEAEKEPEITTEKEKVEE